jgi:hypothetical protein
MSSSKLDASAILKTEADALRPLIHHLNADTSWLIQIPRFDKHAHPYFNVLIDAWLTTSQIEFGRFFHEQAHTIPSAFQTMAEVEAFTHDIEIRACTLRGMSIPDKRPTGYIDVAACCTQGTDHINEYTLRQLHTSVPVLVRDNAMFIKNWNHFETIGLLPAFECDWRETRFPFLPNWLGIGTLTQKKDPQGIHKGLVVSFEHAGHDAEAVVYTPHGILVEEMAFFTSRKQCLHVLALIHGLLNVKVGLSWIGFSDANLGAHNGLKLQRLLDAKYWLSTHDEAKVEKGLTSWILTQNPITLEEALKKEQEEAKHGAGNLGSPNWHAVGNGESLVLT